ncbi:MAG TPA: amidohydrolase [Actinomycetota bacterium]|nr:amidohydrolase [Actinomycetota bacterium]
MSSALVVRAPLAWLEAGSLVRDAAVVVERGLVAYAGAAATAPEPAAAERVDVDGFLMPAVADRHVHVGLADPATVLLRGVTAVRDCGWPADVIFPLADASELPSFTGPLIRAVGPILTAPGGYPGRERWAPPGTSLEVHDPDEGARAVQMLAGRGAVAIKLSLNPVAGPTLSDVDLEAICSAAAEARLPVVAHVEGEGQTERALGAGVRELAHTPWTERLSDSAIQALAKRTRIVSTLDIQSFGGDTPEVRTAVDNLRRFHEAGGMVLYGTDLGNGPIPAGVDVREVLLLGEAGLTPESIIQAMARGPLQRNAPGDLLALGRNPFEELDAFADVRLVVRGGRVVA